MADGVEPGAAYHPPIYPGEAELVVAIENLRGFGVDAFADAEEGKCALSGSCVSVNCLFTEFLTSKISWVGL